MYLEPGTWMGLVPGGGVQHLPAPLLLGSHCPCPPLPPFPRGADFIRSYNAISLSYLDVFILDRTALFELLTMENMFPRIHVSPHRGNQR